MWKLFLINFIIIAISIGILLFSKKIIKTDKQTRILFLILPILTILCHYSSLIYHGINDGTAMDFLRSNPNLVLMIYPCNVVMWILFILGIFWKHREKRVFRVIIDFSFFFGIVSALVGMFANVDFIRNPTLADYDVTKGIVAHGFMLMNVFALGFYKIVKIDLLPNFINLTIGVVFLGIIGAYNNLLLSVIAGDAYANSTNSMFLIHSPFEDIPFLIFPIIVLISLPIYFGIFEIIDLIAYKKGNRWIHRQFKW